MKSKLPIIIIAIFAAAAGAGMGIAVLRKPAAPAVAHAAAEAPSKPLELDEFLVNLADKGEPHYLKTKVVLMVKDSPEAEKGVEADTPRIRDAMILTISQYTFPALVSADGKASLKKAIRQNVNGVLKDDLVTGVYFTSFAMQ